MTWINLCKCGTKKIRNKRYDAYYCPACDIWLEKVCPDQGCDYCPGRPEKPSLAPKE